MWAHPSFTCIGRTILQLAPSLLENEANTEHCIAHAHIHGIPAITHSWNIPDLFHSVPGNKHNPEVVSHAHGGA